MGIKRVKGFCDNIKPWEEKGTQPFPLNKWRLLCWGLRGLQASFKKLSVAAKDLHFQKSFQIFYIFRNIFVLAFPYLYKLIFC